MQGIDDFLRDILGNIVGNTLTDRQKMELLETLYRMLLALHEKLDRIESKIDTITKQGGTYGSR